MTLETKLKSIDKEIEGNIRRLNRLRWMKWETLHQECGTPDLAREEHKDICVLCKGVIEPPQNQDEFNMLVFWDNNNALPIHRECVPRR